MIVPASFFFSPATIFQIVYTTIKKDDRPTGLVQLVDHDFSEGVFPDWAMAFRAEDSIDL